MAAAQVAGTPAVAEVAPGAEGAGDSGEGEGGSIADALKAMQAPGTNLDEEEIGADEGEGDEDEGEAKPEPKKKLEAEAAKVEPAAPAPYDPQAYRQKVVDVLKDLTPEQRDEVLGISEERFAALTGKARRLRAKMGEYQKAAAELESQRNEFSATRAEFDEYLVKGKQNPHEALALFGWSLKDAYEFDATGQIPPEMRQKQIEEELRKKLDEPLEEARRYKEQLEEAQHRLNEQTWHNRVRQTIDTMPADKFPNTARIPKPELFDAVIKLQQAHHTKTKQPLATPNALWQIEQQLTKLRSYYAESDPVRDGGVKSSNPEATTGPKSLSADLASDRASEDGEYEELDPAEATRRALKMLRGR